MKKILSSILILLSMTLIGCSNINNQNKEAQNYPRPIDIISVEPIITCTSDGNEECLVTIKNYTNNVIDNYSLEIINKGTSKFITGISFSEDISPNDEVCITVILPDKYTFKEVDMNITNYH